MTNLEKYHDAMRRYRAGEFGREHLTLAEALRRANEPFLLREMTADEVESLMEETTSPMLKAYFSRLRSQKA